MANMEQNFTTQLSVIAQATGLAAIPIQLNGTGASAVGGIVVPTDQTPGLTKVFASTAVNTATYVVNIPSHGLVTGLLGQMTTTGTLPTGLSTATNYWIIAVDANNIAFASTLANANAGTKIALTAQGSGNDTFTPTAIAGATMLYQVSQDGANWANWTTAAPLTSGTNIAVIPPLGAVPGFRYVRPYFALTSGQLSVQVQTVTKG